MSKFLDEKDKEDRMKLKRDIHINRKSLDVPYQEEVRQIEPTSEIAGVHHRITLLAVLIPCLLGAMVLYAYIDIKEHVDRVRNVGSTEVKALSEDVVDKVSSVSDQYNKLTTSLSNRLATLEASAVVTKERLEKQREAIQKISGSKADNESLAKIEDQTAEAIRGLDALQSGLAAQKQAVENLNKTFGEKMAKLVQGFETMTDERKNEASAIKKLSEGKMDKKSFDEFLKKERESTESVIAPLKQELDALKEGISQLQKQVNMLGRSIQLLEAERTLPEKGASKAASTGDAKAGPGKIIEQEIAE